MKTVLINCSPKKRFCASAHFLSLQRLFVGGTKVSEKLRTPADQAGILEQPARLQREGEGVIAQDESGRRAVLQGVEHALAVLPGTQRDGKTIPSPRTVILLCKLREDRSERLALDIPDGKRVTLLLAGLAAGSEKQGEKNQQKCENTAQGNHLLDRACILERKDR